MAREDNLFKISNAELDTYFDHDESLFFWLQREISFVIWMACHRTADEHCTSFCQQMLVTPTKILTAENQLLKFAANPLSGIHKAAKRKVGQNSHGKDRWKRKDINIEMKLIAKGTFVGEDSF